MKIKVSGTAKPKLPRSESVPPAGWYNGRIESASDATLKIDGLIVVHWSFRSRRLLYRLKNTYTPKDLGHLLFALGHTNEVDLVDLVGQLARLRVVTFGGRTSAGIKEVMPMTE